MVETAGALPWSRSSSAAMVAAPASRPWSVSCFVQRDDLVLELPVDLDRRDHQPRQRHPTHLPRRCPLCPETPVLDVLKPPTAPATTGVETALRPQVTETPFGPAGGVSSRSEV